MRNHLFGYFKESSDLHIIIIGLRSDVGCRKCRKNVFYFKKFWSYKKNRHLHKNFADSIWEILYLDILKDFQIFIPSSLGHNYCKNMLCLKKISLIEKSTSTSKCYGFYMRNLAFRYSEESFDLSNHHHWVILKCRVSRFLYKCILFKTILLLLKNRHSLRNIADSIWKISHSDIVKNLRISVSIIIIGSRSDAGCQRAINDLTFIFDGDITI